MIQNQQAVTRNTQRPGTGERAFNVITNTGPTASRAGRSVSLALQGGGSFGAFTWGFLDRLLEEDVAIDVVSGASAGAVNAVLLADGLAAGGKQAARQRLERFWHRVGHFSPEMPAGHRAGIAALFDVSTKLASPYQLNPLGLNPLRHMLTETVDFERLRAESPVRLRIAATRVKDGRLRLFSEDEITLDAVLASACLPYLHHAIEIDGEAYWDGGYSANPPLRQLILDTMVRDVILIQLLPQHGTELPLLPPDISRRMQEIAFATSLHKELEALEDFRDMCRHSVGLSLICRKLRLLRFHRVSAAECVEHLDCESALDTSWSFLSRLKEHGRSAAAEWLASNAPKKRVRAA